MLGELLDLLQLFDHVFWQHALLNAGGVVGYGLGNPGKVVRILAQLYEINVCSLNCRRRNAFVSLLLGLCGLFQPRWPRPRLGSSRQRGNQHKKKNATEMLHGEPPCREDEFPPPIVAPTVIVSCLYRRCDQGRCCVHFVYNALMSFHPQSNPNAGKRGRTPPPEETFEEASFLKALGEKQKTVTVKLMDGQTVSGWIEYYDKHMVRLTREGLPNLFIFKHEIMYIAEDGGTRK